MSRAQFMRKVDPFESDDEEEVVVKKTVVSTPVVKKPFVQRHYLFVPFFYKDDAKNLGAKFDGNKKQWYTQADNPNKDILVNKYHSANFKSDAYGTHMNANIISKADVEAKKNADLKRYVAEQEKWLKEHKSLDGFGEWYSEHFTGK